MSLSKHGNVTWKKSQLYSNEITSYPGSPLMEVKTHV